MRNLGIFSVLLLIVTIGCAVTYNQPITSAPIIAEALHFSKDEIFKVARQILVAEGYQISSADELSGTISTAPRNLRVTPEQADFGKTMGLDYLKDNRTSTRVAIGVIVDKGSITVKANIEGEYKPGDVIQNITLTCVSTGVLEKDILRKIKDFVGSS